MPALTPEQARAALVLVTTNAVIESSQLVTTNAARTQAAMFEAVPALVAYYSDGTSALAADYYDDLRDEAGAGGRYMAEPVVNLREEKIRAGVLWSVQPLLLPEPDPALTVSRIGDVVQLETARPFRDTITTNRRRDPSAVGWKRVTLGGCKFCRYLAGRGEVYKESTARFACHPNCNCTAVPVFHDGDGEEVDVLKYAASKRREHRTPKQRQAINDALARMDGGAVKSATKAMSTAPKSSALSGFAGMSRAQVQKQINILDGLKDSEYRTAQLARLHARLKEL